MAVFEHNIEDEGEGCKDEGSEEDGDLGEIQLSLGSLIGFASRGGGRWFGGGIDWFVEEFGN